MKRFAAFLVASGTQAVGVGAAVLVTGRGDAFGWLMFLGGGVMIVSGVRLAIDVAGRFE